MASLTAINQYRTKPLTDKIKVRDINLSSIVNPITGDERHQDLAKASEECRSFTKLTTLWVHAKGGLYAWSMLGSFVWEMYVWGNLCLYVY